MFYSRLLRDVGAEPSPELQELSKQFRLQKTRDVEENVLHLEVYTIPSLPGGLDVPGAEGAARSNPDHLERPSDTAPALGPWPICSLSCLRRRQHAYPWLRSGGFYRPITGLCTGKQAHRLEIRS